MVLTREEAGDSVKVVAKADDKTHEKIEYWAVVIKTSGKQPAAQHFLDYLSGKEAKAILMEKGFLVDQAGK